MFHLFSKGFVNLIKTRQMVVNKLCLIMFQVLLEMSPGMGVDKYVLSSDDLKQHRDVLHHWGPCQLVRKLMSDDGFDANLTNPITGKEESLQDLVCFGSPEVLKWNKGHCKIPAI